MAIKQASQKAGQLKAVDFKGRRYVQVHSRLNSLRGCGEDGIVWENGKGKDWGIENVIVKFDDKHAMIQTRITDETGRLRSTGEAVEYRDDKNSFVNAHSYLENCATSAMGRALAALGIGTEDSFASADELAVAISQQGGGGKGPAKREVMSDEWKQYFLDKMHECQSPDKADLIMAAFIGMADDVDFFTKNRNDQIEMVWDTSVNIPTDAMFAMLKAHREVIKKFTISQQFCKKLKHAMDNQQNAMLVGMFVNVDTDQPLPVPLISEHRARVFPSLKDWLENNFNDEGSQDTKDLILSSFQGTQEAEETA
jgi:hypothetical protein